MKDYGHSKDVVRNICPTSDEVLFRFDVPSLLTCVPTDEAV